GLPRDPGQMEVGHDGDHALLRLTPISAPGRQGEDDVVQRGTVRYAMGILEDPTGAVHARGPHGAGHVFPPRQVSCATSPRSNGALSMRSSRWRSNSSTV